ncbi:hypothetical protein DL766_002261 [Monosporascus sp. MC13-8B]|nr:hypothetical protein DL766_002261 [Monosporascus sp. MC13-8B]
MAVQKFSPATGVGSSAHSPTTHQQHEDQAPLRERRLEYFFQRQSSEDFTTRILGGTPSHDHVGSMEAKLEKLAEQIGKADDNGSSKVGGDAAQISGEARREQEQGRWQLIC